MTLHQTSLDFGKAVAQHKSLLLLISHLRSQYPNLSHLEAGNIAQWLQERKDGLFEKLLITK
ncbi:hypothetical protein [Nostoc sp.]|uniref:hypothetical protein n=1 Tax=Nostoc sp. TaxID=1180 RepID=UPI002FFD4761